MKYLKDSTLLTSCLVVFFGGSLGSLFRLLITEIPHIGSSPWVIVVINVLGSFFLAYIGAVIPDSYDYSLILKNFIGTGIMGGFTTFSTFILQINQLGRENFLISIIYTLISFILAYIAVVFGKNVGKNRRSNQ